MARCEIHTRKAEAALPRLLPYLLVKRPQALLLRELCRLKAQPKPRSISSGPRALQGAGITSPRRRFSPNQVAAMDLLYFQLIALHEGSSPGSGDLACSIEPGSVDRPEWTRGETLAYLAGIIDSDGSFRIEKRNARRMLAPHYRISIRATQVSPSAAIGLLARTFGGHVTTKKSNRPQHRNLAYWSVHDKSAADALNALLPHLVVKKQQAALLLELRRKKAQGKQGLTEWIHRTRWQRPIKMHKRCYTPKQVAEFERIRRELNSLHSGKVVDWRIP